MGLGVEWDLKVTVSSGGGVGVACLQEPFLVKLRWVGEGLRVLPLDLGSKGYVVHMGSWSLTS